MIARLRFAYAYSCFGLSLCWSLSTIAIAQPIASFHDDFQLTTPAPNWAYLWNATGPIGNPANYQALLPLSDGTYTTDGLEVRPSPAPGNFLSMGLSNGIAVGHPGMGATQVGSENIERFCIAAYTLTSANTVGILDGFLRNRNPNSGGSTDGLSVKVFVNDVATPFFESVTSPGVNMSANFNVSLGDLVSGDTIYVAVGSRNSDLFDGFELRYRIVAVPEPSAALLAGFAASFLWFRRQRTCLALNGTGTVRRRR